MTPREFLALLGVATFCFAILLTLLAWFAGAFKPMPPTVETSYEHGGRPSDEGEA